MIKLRTSLINHHVTQKTTRSAILISLCAFVTAVTFLSGRCLATIGWINIQTHSDWWEGFMKYAVETGSEAMIHIPSFIKIVSGSGFGFDSRRYQIFWEVVVLERGPLSLMSITEELLEWKSSGSGSRKPRLTAVGIRCADHVTPSIRKIWH
jgi:hypothetical protein